MILKIGFKPENIVHVDMEKGEILVKVEHFGPWANGCNLVTVNAHDKETYDANPKLKARTMLIGVKGGITSEGW